MGCVKYFCSIAYACRASACKAFIEHTAIFHAPVNFYRRSLRIRYRSYEFFLQRAECSEFIYSQELDHVAKSPYFTIQGKSNVIRKKRRRSCPTTTLGRNYRFTRSGRSGRGRIDAGTRQLSSLTLRPRCRLRLDISTTP